MQNIFLSIIMISLVVSPKKDIETYKPIVVLELFTSQGCSSCPSADDLLYNVRKESKDVDVNIIALSYHVDYWNYIGWKDPFSKKEFSEKQRLYSKKFNSSTIYTPQIVVNGLEHFVGSKSDVMKSKIDTYINKYSKNKVVISNLEKRDKLISFNYNVLGEKTNKKLRAVLVINDRITSVKNGENRNRTLKNSNIVVQENYLNIENKKANVSIPEIVSKTDKLTLMLIVENNELDIVGGSQINVN